MSNVKAGNRNLKRPIEDMPKDLGELLRARGLVALYDARPAYQRNDYLRWIQAAKRVETRSKRVDQMLEELEAGDVYMRMAWNGSRDVRS